MMIGLCGATCNNLYVLAKSLAGNGHAIVFIEDRKDNFPHSQPVWDDVYCCLPAGFDYLNINWPQFEKDHNWTRPTWYYIPGNARDDARALFKKSSKHLDIITRFSGSSYLRKFPGALSVFDKMLECDFLIVCGIEQAVLAMLTGRPYMIFPHGSDMRVAIGVENKGAGWKGRLIEWLTSRSFQEAAFIGSSLPDGSAEVPRSEYRRLKNLKVERIPLPYQYRGRLSKEERFNRLKSLFASLNRELPAAELYAFTPSRINFFWKGHDRLLRATAQNCEKVNNIHFIFLGWGDDYQEAMSFVIANSLQQHVTILPIFLSKEFLFKFFQSIDFIIDEFNGSGSYGTSLSEAMSCGCPVLTWISDMFDAPGWERPPVIQARTEEQIATALMKVSSGEINLDAQSELTADWFKRVHEEEAVMCALFNNIKKHLNK